MRSTGEVMGHDLNFGLAFAKSQIAAGCPLPETGTVLITVNDFDKGTIVRIARDLSRLGFGLAATHGTAEVLTRAGLEVTRWNKVSEGSPHVVDAVREGKVHMVINTPLGTQSYGAGQAIRRAAIEFGLPLLTTMSAAQAAVAGMRASQDGTVSVRSLQSLR